MNLYSTYHARYMAGFLLRDFIEAEKKTLIVRRPRQLKGFARPSSFMDVFLTRSFLPKAASFADQSKIDLYDMFQKVLKRYTDGNDLMRLVPENSEIDFAKVVVAAFQLDENRDLYNRLKKRKEVYCETPEAATIATKCAWEDLSAISRVFATADNGANKAYTEAIGTIQRHIDAELQRAIEQSRGIVLERNVDFVIIP